MKIESRLLGAGSEASGKDFCFGHVCITLFGVHDSRWLWSPVMSLARVAIHELIKYG